MVMPHGWDVTTDAKVHYRRRDGVESTAYIEESTGRGSDRYTDVSVIVKWSEEEQIWLQVDTWEWSYRSVYDATPDLKDPEKHQEESTS